MEREEHYNPHIRETDLPKPPDIFTTTTGGEELNSAITMVDNFFREVLDFIGYKQRAIDAFTRIESRYLTLGQLTKSDLATPSQPYLSDDFIRILKAKDYIIASGIFRRDDFNYLQIATAQYLNPTMVERLQEGIIGSENNT